MNFFGGSTLFEKLLNPAGWLHSTQTEAARKQAEAATQAAQAAEEQAKATLASQQLAINQAALTANENAADKTTSTDTASDALGITTKKRTRGADVTLGL